jgi:hypothetical protein
MIRFVDLTPVYWTDPDETSPCCAFLSTNTDRFLQDMPESMVGAHVCNGPEDVAAVEEANEIVGRLSAMVPDGFWKV